MAPPATEVTELEHESVGETDCEDCRPKGDGAITDGRLKKGDSATKVFKPEND